jgi:hypothetical protein
MSYHLPVLGYCIIYPAVHGFSAMNLSLNHHYVTLIHD